MPALPLVGRSTRSPANTPANTSPIDEVEGVSKAVDDLTIDNGPMMSDATEPPAPTSPVATASTDIVESAKMEPAKDDDVFGASATTEHREDVIPVPLAQNIVATRPEGNIRTPMAYNGFEPRPDRVSQLPNARNAQGLYPPDALIFVANLSNQRSPDHLYVSCQQTFGGFGPCHIKVLLDKNRHPFAFVQFENVEDANAAVDAASNMMMDGRKIRVERAKAERAVILSRQDGGNVSEAEARHMLSKYGPIELCVHTQAMDRSKHNMAAGVYVKFAYYLDCRDALRSFNNHAGGYNLYMAPPVEPRLRPGPNGSPVVRGFSTPRSAVDQKSIYVGNLPEGTTRPELEGLFNEFGTIVQVNVIRKDFAEDSVNIFGFIEFSNPKEAERASMAERSLHGVKLRVEPKEYSARRTQRTAYVPPTPVRQNTPRRHVDAGYSGNAMNYNNQNMYGMQSMATPPGGYNQGYAMPGFNPSAVPFLGTPTHTAMNNMAPMGMFSPSPAHNVNEYGQGHFYNYSSPLYPDQGHMMGSIPEDGEAEY
ncbi:hypothetical protein A1O1_07901 [Capronia coronata CBS 617.96]|uniref:RRM domain-containing protein n=1 Tax=Capronia coronata CBS 617.96 TaxID=1182541 RepID=W9XY31_9EURO|nr:uncharacterized protein A1O1_07901 [Capronia coronata CBS 617.96]EXJ81836.1 hypothetical protein A1O1_07901 [Capronia coronata CBS 617.96]